MPLSTIFQLFRGGQFYWWRKPQTFRKSLSNFCHITLYRVYLTWAGFKLTTLLVIGTDCIGSCKSNYHMTTTTSPLMLKEMFEDTKVVIKSCISKEMQYNGRRKRTTRQWSIKTQKTKDWATQTIQRKKENGGALFLQMHSSFLISGSWKTSFSKGQGCCILVYINHFYLVSPDLLNESLVVKMTTSIISNEYTSCR